MKQLQIFDVKYVCMFYEKLLARHALLWIGTIVLPTHGNGYTWNINVGYVWFYGICMFLRGMYAMFL